MKEVTIFCDGSCSGNPGPGGWATVLTHGEISKTLTGHDKLTTNNIMELTAALEAIRALKSPCKVTLHTDSEYVVNGFKKGWVENWKKNGWRTKAKKPVANMDLWLKLDMAIKNHEVTWTWISRDDNIFCDDLARKETEKAKNMQWSLDDLNLDNN